MHKKRGKVTTLLSFTRSNWIVKIKVKIKSQDQELKTQSSADCFAFFDDVWREEKDRQFRNQCQSV